MANRVNIDDREKALLDEGIHLHQANLNAIVEHIKANITPNCAAYQIYHQRDNTKLRSMDSSSSPLFKRVHDVLATNRLKNSMLF